LAKEKIPDVVKLDPELVVRESTAAVRVVEGNTGKRASNAMKS
jgi:hypothetical protein